MSDDALPTLETRRSLAGMTFWIALNRSLTPSEIDRLQPAIDTLRGELPVHFELTGTRLDSQRSGMRATACRLGHARQRMRPDGRPQWQVNAAQDKVFVECTDCRQWSQEWSRARRYLEIASGPLLSAVPGADAVALVHSAVDRFTLDCAADDYDYGSVFVRDSPYLTAQMQSAGPVWHVHQGWFETLELPLRGRLLQILNLGALFENGRSTTIVDHGLHYQFPSPQPLSQFFGSRPHRLIDTLFEDAHRRNTRMLSWLIQPARLAEGAGGQMP